MKTTKTSRTKKPALIAKSSKHEAEEQALAMLAASGLSKTQARIEILAELILSDCVRSVEDLAEKLRSKKYDLATIYRTMTTFDEAGFLERVVFTDGIARYELKRGHAHHHHHVICRSCKSITMVHECISQHLNDSVAKLGFADVQHSLEFSGICRSCAARLKS